MITYFYVHVSIHDYLYLRQYTPYTILQTSTPYMPYTYFYAHTHPTQVNIHLRSYKHNKDQHYSKPIPMHVCILRRPYTYTCLHTSTPNI